MDIGPGFTALVGPNNSGKSAFLRFIYEFYPLWNELKKAPFIAGVSSDAATHTDLGKIRGVVDLNEVVCDYTRRPMSFSFDLIHPPSSSPHLKGIYGETLEGRPNTWRIKPRISKESSKIHSSREPNVLLNAENQPIWWEPFEEIFKNLRDCMFAPAFRNAINEGSGTFFDLAVGTNLVTQWNNWKAGDNRNAKLAIQKITNDICHIFGFRSLEINSSASGKTFEVIVDGRPFRLNDLGSGLSQFIILFANAAVKTPSILLVDEPELNLHPRLQVDFLTALASYTRTGTVIFATHSLGLARAIGDRIYTFSPTEDGTAVQAYEATPNYPQFAGEMGFGSYQALGFRTILMVEGPSEIKAIQQLLRLLGEDHNVVTLHLGGSSMIAAGREIELAELRRISDRVAVLIDSEKVDKDAGLSPSRAAFIEACRTLGFMTHVTELRAFENYLPIDAIREVKGRKYRALGPYEALKEMSPAWDKSENWRIARRITKAQLMETDVGVFLKRICSI